MVSSEYIPASCYLQQNFMTKKLWCMHEVPENYVLSALISAFVYFKYSPPSLWEQTPFAAVVSLSGWKFEINAGGN